MSESEERVNRKYTFKLLFIGVPIHEYGFFTLEEIDRRSAQYEDRKGLLKAIESKTGKKYSLGSTSIQIWYYPNKEKKKKGDQNYGEKEKKPKMITPIVYEEDKSIFNKEYILDKFDSHTRDEEFVLRFIRGYMGSKDPVISDAVAVIKNSIYDFSKYKPYLDELTSKLFNGYLHYRNMYFFMKNYEKSLEKNNKERITSQEEPISPPQISPTVPPLKPLTPISKTEVRGGEQVGMSFIQPESSNLNRFTELGNCGNSSSEIPSEDYKSEGMEIKHK